MKVALIGVGIQMLAVYWTYFRLGNGAQGKSLFPVLVPCLVLLWVGIEAWVPPARGRGGSKREAERLAAFTLLERLDRS